MHEDHVVYWRLDTILCMRCDLVGEFAMVKSVSTVVFIAQFPISSLLWVRFSVWVAVYHMYVSTRGLSPGLELCPY